MFDEYFKPSPSVVSLTIFATTLSQDTTRATSSNTIDQDAPSPVSQSPRGIFINQSKYELEMLKKYGLESSDAVETPMVERSKLDLGFAVKPTEKYLTVVKRVFQYLKGTINIGCQDIRRSTSGSAQFLGEKLVS
ncbi:uncharacterized mitochondrial protein-like protein [Tanacetum coccineum]